MDIRERQALLTRALGEYRWLQGATVVAIALSCATPLALNLVDPDLWGHVRYGQDWLAAGELPRTATHTYTATNHPWINHENLAELVLALGSEYLGAKGLLVGKCLWGMGILLAMVWIARRQQVHLFTAWAWMLLIAVNFQAFFRLRPQLLSFGLCAAALVLLDRAFCRWHESRRVDWRWLGMLPVVFAIWVNAHGGFVLGLCIVGAYLGGRIIDLGMRRSHALPQVVALFVLGGCCLLATLCNPYGLEMHRWLLASLSAARPEIAEWAAPKLSDPIFWPWIALMAAAAGSLWHSRLQRDWVQIVILLLVAWQSALHLRHIAFLSLLCGFWIPPHLQSALGRLLPARGSQLPVMTLSPWLRRLAFAALAVAIGLQSFALQRRLTDLPVEPDDYPVDALQFMVDNQLDGKLVVCFNWAQYAIAALAPETQVGFDGRFRTCYPQEIIDMHFDFLLGKANGKRNRSPYSGPIDGTRVLNYKSPDLVLLDLEYEHATAVMQAEAARANPQWVLLYRDELAEIWGRSAQFDEPTHCDYFPLTARRLEARPLSRAVQWPALPERKANPQLAAGESKMHDQRNEDDSI
ncbi:MAG: hypothetical protein MI725_08120 [Pirellulales bacterium]|nr:hypothetical protein [Pirellulales bacterium]